MIFVYFKKIIHQQSQHVKLAVDKSFFRIFTRLCFLLVDCVLRISETCCTYKKCLLVSKLSYGINQMIIRHVEVPRRQEKVIFVHFNKIIHQHSQHAKLAVEKSFFRIFTKLCFLLVECVLRISETCCTCKKCLLVPKLSFGINQMII